MEIKKMPKNAKKYYCTKCDFGTDKMSNYNNHLSTRKHSMEIYGNKKMPKCKNCKIQFKSNSGLWKHEKKCFQGCKDSVTNINKQNNTHKEIDDTTQDSKNIVLELITQNQDFKDLLLEQNKQFQILQDKNHEIQQQLIELASETKNITNNNNTNNNSTINNRFNMNIFLNEQCKDAMNLSDFLNNIEVSLEDVSNVGRLGYADGISRIIINALKDMDVYERPIHCSDIKREIMYIKENDIWEKDDERKYQMKRVLKLISHKNVKRLLDWREAHPGWLVYDSKEEAECLRITSESMGGGSDEENERLYKKMIRKIAHETLIDKKLVE